MALKRSSLKKLIAIIAENEQLCCTIHESSKGALVAGTSTFVGGLLLGPIGLLIGSAIGSATAYHMVEEFRPLADVLDDFTEEQWERFDKQIMQIAKSFGIDDVAKIFKFIMLNPNLKAAILKFIIQFIANELRLLVSSRRK